MVLYEKIYFEAYTNDQYTWHKNNTVQLYFTLGTAELWKILVDLGMPLEKGSIYWTFCMVQKFCSLIIDA